MKKWLKAISFGLVWLPVALMIVYVDPNLVKDVGIQNSYLPFVILVWLALLYDLQISLKSWRLSVAISIALSFLLISQMLRI